MRKALILLLVLLTGLLFAISCSAEPVAQGTWDSTGAISWALSSDGVLTITGTGQMGIRPAAIQERCKEIKTIVVEDGVKTLGADAFSGCSNLTSVSIPTSVTGISTYVFYGCTSLERITIPDSVMYIGPGVYRTDRH